MSLLTKLVNVKTPSLLIMDINNAKFHYMYYFISNNIMVLAFKL